MAKSDRVRPSVAPIGEGRVIDNPISGERIVIRESGAQNGGRLLAFDLFLPAGGHVPARHVHPLQEERFTVLSGRMRFRIGRRTVLASPGQTVVVPAGAAHWFGNAGPEVSRAGVEVRPALRMEELFEATVKAAWPYMVAQHYGKIILTTSVSGLIGLRGQATYAAAKCAVVGLMRILAIEGAEHGILVNTIAPVGYTRMHPAAGSRVSEADGKSTTPVEAVAPAIVWLASDGCSETNSIYCAEAGAIQRVAIVWGPGFYDPHLTPESIAENYAKVESIEGSSEPNRFEPGIQ